MSVALRLYEQLTEAGEDKTRAKLIAEAFEQFEERYPNLKEIATQGHVRESELRFENQFRNLNIGLEKFESNLLTAIHRHTYWVIGSVATMICFIRLLDWMLA